VTMYMIPINLWSVVVSHSVIGFQKESSYAFGFGSAWTAAITPSS
jgi:hypothetical protein